MATALKTMATILENDSGADGFFQFDEIPVK